MAEALKGHLDSLILAVIAAEPAHGYVIIEELKRRSGGTFTLPGGDGLPGAAPARARRVALQRLVRRERSSAPRLHDHAPRTEAARGEQERVARLRACRRRGARVIYLDDLSRELAAHGIRGRARRRIVAEFDDHLRSDAGAEQRLGSPREIANAFAAELGAQASRRAAVGAFGALGVAGAVYAASFVSLQLTSQPHDLFEPLLGALAFGVVIVCPQVAFVSGLLALVRAIRLRGERVVPTSELPRDPAPHHRRGRLRPRHDGRARPLRLRLPTGSSRTGGSR